MNTQKSASSKLALRGLLLALSISVTGSGWAFISVRHPAPALMQQLPKTYQEGLKITVFERPIAITRSSR